MTTIRGVSLTEPWATLVAIGAKKWETRSWPAAYRGPIAIQAATKFPKACRELVYEEPFSSALRHAGVTHGSWALGHIIATADLIDCIQITATNAPDEPERSFGDYTPGRFMWRLENVRRLPSPIACKGALGLWAVPPEIVARLGDVRP